MHIKQISIEQEAKVSHHPRPTDFDSFVGQEDIKNILKKAIISAQKRQAPLGHILLSGPSGYGKTTLAGIVANEMRVRMHTITGYAIAKPSDLMTVLTMLEKHDILFIDEIHRLKPIIEEMLYIAMEEYAIDMVMPDGGHLRIPIKPFTLIGATTKSESLTEPFKNRFIYTFHFTDYTHEEKVRLVKRYMDMYIKEYEENLIPCIANKVDTVPREIHNLCIKIRDYLVAHNEQKLTKTIRSRCESRLNVDDGGITPLHKKYLELVSQAKGPIGLKTLSLKLGVNEKTIENEIEPLLLKLGKIEKTGRGRIVKST